MRPQAGRPAGRGVGGDAAEEQRSAQEGLANRVFDELSSRAERLVARCQWRTEPSEVIAGSVGFPWAVAA